MFLIYSYRSYGSLIYLCNQWLSPLNIWVRIPLIERCIHCIYDCFYLTIGCYSIQHYVIVCQRYTTGCWFSPGTPVSSTTKTDRHDLISVCAFAERLLLVVADDTGCFLIYKPKGIVPHYFHQLTGKSRQHIWHFPHQGGGRLQCQTYQLPLQSVLQILPRSAEPVKLLNSTTRPTRFGVFHLTASDIVYDVMCKWLNTPIGCLWHFNL